MKSIKKIGISLGYIIIPIIIIIFILTLLNYIGIINYKFFNAIRFIIFIFCILFGSFKYGKSCLNKGWLEGLKLGLIIIIIDIFLNYIIFNNNFNIKHIIYFSVILGSSILGSIIGINKKQKNKGI